MADPEFLWWKGGGTPNVEGTPAYYLNNFPSKLHEIKEYWAIGGGGGDVPCGPFRSPIGNSCPILFCYQYQQKQSVYPFIVAASRTISITFTDSVHISSCSDQLLHTGEFPFSSSIRQWGRCGAGVCFFLSSSMISLLTSDPSHRRVFLFLLRTETNTTMTFTDDIHISSCSDQLLHSFTQESSLVRPHIQVRCHFYRKITTG